MLVHRATIEANYPKDWIAVWMAARDPAKDTATTIDVPAETYRAIRHRWNEKTTKGATGLGDYIEKAIDVVTFGRGKAFASAVAKVVGAKDCGCGRRKAALNDLGKQIGIGASAE